MVTSLTDMHYSIKRRVFTKTYWRYLLERTHAKLHKKASQRRLGAQISRLPPELRLELLEHYMQKNPISVDDNGRAQHPLLDKTGRLGAREQTVVHFAAPIALNFPFVKSAHPPSPKDWEDWIAKWQFLDSHNNRHGEASRKLVRLKVTIACPSDCPQRLSIYCDHLGNVTQWPMPEDDCQEPNCGRTLNQRSVTESIAKFTSGVAETTGIARGNITTEFIFEHKCSVLDVKACQMTHRSCRLKWLILEPPLMLGMIVGTYIGGALVMAFAPKHEYRVWLDVVQGASPTERRLARVFVAAPIALAGIAFMPLAQPLKWTALGLMKAMDSVYLAWASREISRNATGQDRMATAENRVDVDVLGAQNRMPALQLGSLDIESHWEESTLYLLNEVMKRVCEEQAESVGAARSENILSYLSRRNFPSGASI